MTWILAALLWPSLSFAQGAMAPPQIALQTINGVTRPIANATITVCAAGASGIPCAPALVGTIFKDLALTQALANPFTSDANGNYQFAAAPGTYTVTVTAAGFAGNSYQATLSPNASSSTIWTGTNTFSGPTTLPGTGNAAIKPAASDAYEWVSPTGLDTQDCRSYGSACATLIQAYANLPSTGGTIYVAGPSYSTASPVAFTTANKPLRVKCVGTASISNATPVASTILNFTGSSGIFVTFGGYSGEMDNCTLNGPNTGTSQGLGVGTAGNGLVNGIFRDDVITGFPGGGIIEGNASAAIMNTEYDNVISADNGGLDYQIPSTSKGLEKSRWRGGLITESGSTFNQGCVNIGSGSDVIFDATSFDSCGVTLAAAGPNIVDFISPHFENLGATTNLPYVLISGSAEFVSFQGGEMLEDSVSSGRTEFVKATGTNSQAWAFGTRFSSAETVAQAINASGSNASCGQVGARLNSVTVGCASGNSNASSINIDHVGAVLGWGEPLTLDSSGGGSITESAPNTASTFAQTKQALAGTQAVNVTGAVSISSGFGTSPSIVNQSPSAGAIAFEVNVGTGGTATSGVLTLPAAPVGWSCQTTDMNTNIVTRETAFLTTSVTLTAASAWTASDKLLMTCWPF